MRNAISIVFLFAIGFAATQNTKAQLDKTPVTETASVVRRMAGWSMSTCNPSVDADAKLGATGVVSYARPNSRNAECSRAMIKNTPENDSNEILTQLMNF